MLYLILMIYLLVVLGILTPITFGNIWTMLDNFVRSKLNETINKSTTSTANKSTTSTTNFIAQGMTKLQNLFSPKT